MTVERFTLLSAGLSFIVSCSCSSPVGDHARKAVDIYLKEMLTVKTNVGRQTGKYAPWRTNKIAHVE